MSSDAVVEKEKREGGGEALSLCFFFPLFFWLVRKHKKLACSVLGCASFFETHFFFFFFFFCLGLCSGSKVLSRFVVVTDMFSYMAFLEFFSGMLLWCF